MQETKIKLESKIKEMINSGELKIRPKWYFVAIAALYALGFLLLLLICILFISILLFKSRTLPPHKAYELFTSLETLPFMILGLFALLIISAYTLRSNYSFIYKKPALASIFFLLILMLSLSYLIDIMSLHDKIEKRMHVRPMFMIDKMYKPRYNH